MEELNLLPFALKRKQMGSRKKRKYFLIGLSVVSVLILAFLIPVLLYISAGNKNNAAQEKLNETMALNIKNKQIEASINVDKLYLKSVDMLTKEKYFTKDNISLFQSFMTKDAYIKSFAYNRLGVQISGSAKNYSSPSEFAANMQLSGKFAEVRLSNVTVTKDGVDFVISVTY